MNINKSKKVWNGVKDIVHFKSKTSQKMIKMVQNDVEITDPKLVANAFNNYFANVGVNLARLIPDFSKSSLGYLKNPSCKSFPLFPVTPVEIENEISHLKFDKATGQYSIPVNILKILKSVISVTLATLFNISLSTGLVPSKFKVANAANVIPIQKKDCHTDLSNYCPISLLSTFNKLLEKIVSGRLLKFLEKEKMLFQGQFSFRSNHSTDFAILSIVDRVQHAIDQGDLSCGIFLDFSKAFDTVDHIILIEKLDFYGIRGIAKDWFTSYLTNRQQFVTVNDLESGLTNISCGIPWGSVLGLILFFTIY